MKNKKGASHIEVILSFVIFLGFLIFLIAVFNPFTSVRKGDNLDNVERAIRNSTETELEFMTIRLEKEEKKCFSFAYQLRGDISVKNESMNYIRGIKKGNDIYIDDGGTFFYIYSSTDFEPNEFDTINCEIMENKDNEKKYSLGLYKNYSVISFNKINLLSQEYNSDYLSLKSTLGITGEFGFGVRDTSGNQIITARRVGKNVYAKDVPIQLIYSNGNLTYGIMNIQTWA